MKLAQSRTFSPSKMPLSMERDLRAYIFPHLTHLGSPMQRPLCHGRARRGKAVTL
jgi:hypothetical protein